MKIYFVQESIMKALTYLRFYLELDLFQWHIRMCSSGFNCGLYVDRLCASLLLLHSLQVGQKYIEIGFMNYERFGKITLLLERLRIKMSTGGLKDT